MMQEFETIIFEQQNNGISILTLNRPNNLNALSIQLLEEFNKVLDYLEWNFDCRVLIITGNGKAFSAGTDLKEAPSLRAAKSPAKYSHMQVLNMGDPIKTNFMGQKWAANTIVKMRRIPQPIIAAINGAAVGGGFGIAMAADIRIASTEARFNNAFIKLGFSGCDFGSSYFLPRLIGLSRASDLLYTGRFFDAEEAEKIGFVSKVVPPEELMNAAQELAEDLLNKSPLGLRATKEVINLSIDAPSLEAAVLLENRNQIITGNTKDIMEGITAFFEKRKPKYGLR